MSERIYFSIVDVDDALRGTPDHAKVYGVVPAAVTHWEFGELFSCVSLDGVCRVLAQAKMKRVAVREEEPGIPARVLFETFRDACNAVLGLIELPGCSGDGQCDQDSSSLGGVVGTSEPNGEGR